MRYRDAAKMIDWLGQAFGFERRMVIDDGSGGIAHAELTLGNGMIMLGSAREDAFGKLQSTPAALGGTTQSAYIVVGDVGAAYAKAAGAEMIGEIRQQIRPRLFVPRSRRPSLELRRLQPLNLRGLIVQALPMRTAWLRSP